MLSMIIAKKQSRYFNCLNQQPKIFMVGISYKSDGAFS